jgi:putative hydrolase of the HAD superfamily
MPRDAFAHVRHWVFDLDNTLYPPDINLFPQIEQRINAFVMRELGLDADAAQDLRHRYWRAHGTTLRGLMLHHDTDPDPFLAEVHDIDLSAIAPDPGLAARLAALPGRRIVFTNGSRQHARNVTRSLGISHLFDGLYGIEDAGYEPKPAPAAFARIFAAASIDGPKAAMFEDEARNLATPHRLGMRTVLVGDDDPFAGHVQHRTASLHDFLDRIA